RRGYPDHLLSHRHASGHDGASLIMNRALPTFFANPFRSPEAGDLVPLNGMVQTGVQASMLRAHPFVPRDGYNWGTDANDDGDNLLNETTEAGYGDDNSSSGAAQVPLFSELATTPSIDGKRNTAM